MTDLDLVRARVHVHEHEVYLLGRFYRLDQSGSLVTNPKHPLNLDTFRYLLACSSRSIGHRCLVVDMCILQAATADENELCLALEQARGLDNFRTFVREYPEACAQLLHMLQDKR